MSGLNLTLKIWRQKDAKTKGQFETVKINDVSPDMSFLEGQGRLRLRPRLPRRYLWHVLSRHQRYAARS